MATLTDTEFSHIAIENDLDPIKINEKLKALYPERCNRPGRVETRINNLRKKGILPLDSGNSVSRGEILKGTSTLYDETGAIKRQWVKTDVEKESVLAAFTEAVDNVISRLPESSPSTFTPSKEIMNDYISVYTIGDAHIGMLAWEPESGEDNDLITAEERHIKAMELLVEQSRPSTEAFIVDVGDFFHSDNMDNRTAASGHSLDVDGRYAKVLEIGLTLTTKLIDLALAKHETVHWRSAIGN